MRRLVTVTEMTLRQLVRRRGVLLLLLLLPLGFYLLRRNDYVGQSIRSLFMGIGWAVSTAALFATGASREIEPRLRLSGYAAHHLYLGRMLALWLLGLGLVVPFFVLTALDTPGLRHGAVALAMLCCVAVAAPLGALIGVVLPRDLEGTLLLLTIVGLQMTMDPADAMAKAMPFWSSREIATYAVDHTDAGYLVRGSVHGLVYAVLLTALVAVASTVRLRRRRHLRLAASR
jgi:hypothetical protein